MFALALLFPISPVTPYYFPPLLTSTVNIEALVPSTPKPDYDKEVLQPLHEAEAQDAIIAAQEALRPTSTPEVVTYTTPVYQPVYTPPAQVSDYKTFIYDHESGSRPDAINPSSGACGLGQALPCSKLPCTLQDYSCQDTFFTQYAVDRYGSWEQAYYFWIANNWW